jgi:hypothetical protein
METKLLFNKLNEYLKNNIKISLINREMLIITKDFFIAFINAENKNIPSFNINNDNSVIESMIIKDLCYKQINDLYTYYEYFSPKYCFARNEYNIYYYDIK